MDRGWCMTNFTFTATLNYTVDIACMYVSFLIQWRHQTVEQSNVIFLLRLVNVKIEHKCEVYYPVSRFR